MQSLNVAILSYLEKHAQPQRFQTIEDHLWDAGYREFSKADLDVLVEDGKLTLVTDGVDAGGNPMQHYAPLNFDPNAESPNATARLRY